MKYTVRQKLFAPRSEYLITDADGREIYRLLGDDFIGRTLHMCDTRGEEAGVLHFRRRRGLVSYQVERHGETLKMRQKLTFLNYRFAGEASPWEVAIGLTGRRFTLREGHDGPVRLTARKRLFCWGECFAAEISPGADPVLCLLLLLGAGRR